MLKNYNFIKSKESNNLLHVREEQHYALRIILSAFLCPIYSIKQVMIEIIYRSWEICCR